MLQWLAENIESIVALLTVAAVVVKYLRKVGVIQKARGDVLTQVLEDVGGVAIRVAKQVRQKNAKATDSEIANAIMKALKGEASERAFKTGLRSVVEAVADGAAVTDPDEKKKPRSGAARLIGLLRPRFLGG